MRSVGCDLLSLTSVTCCYSTLACLDSGDGGGSPTKWTVSSPFTMSGVIAQVPRQEALATLLAVSGPAARRVKPLPIPPRMQKAALKGK